MGSYTTTGRYKTSGNFTAAKTAIYGGSETTYAYYSAEAGGWINAAVSGDTYEISSNTDIYGSSTFTSQNKIGEIKANVTFRTITVNRTGGGTVTLTSGTLYGGRYAVSGSSLTFRASGLATTKLSEVKVNGTAIQTSSGAFTITANADKTVSVTFVPTSYTLSIGSLSGGSATVKVNGAVKTLPVQVNSGDVIQITSTADANHVFSHLSVNGVRSVSNPHSFTVTDSPTVLGYAIEIAFSAKSSYSNTVTKQGDGTVTLTSGGDSVTVTNNTFTAYPGVQYDFLAAAGTGSSFVGWYENGVLLSDSASWSFVQGDAPRTIQARFSENERHSVTFAAGSGPNSYGSGDAAYSAGCRCSLASSPSQSSGKYASGTFSFLVIAGSGWTFDRLYVEDLSLSGGTTEITGASSGSVTVEISFDARVVAIFRNSSASSEPSDVDQGVGQTNVSSGLREWEGGSVPMTATWKSRRYVMNRPASFAGGQVYADGYDANSVSISLHQFQSPDTDAASSSVTRTVPSQDGFRFAARRPEKYLEIGIETKSQVTQATVSTSMGGIWRTNV